MRSRALSIIGYLILLFGVGFLGIELMNQQHDSALSRVSTVEQRCELTDLVLNEAHNPANIVKLERSYGKCKASLVKVKAEAGVK